MINKTHVRQQFNKSALSYNKAALVQKKVCGKLVQQILYFQKTNPDKVFEIGCGTGFLTQLMLKHFKPESYICNDLTASSQFALQPIFDNLKYTNWEFIEGDAEKIDYPKQCACIVSSSAIQWFDDLDGFLLKAKNTLKQGSLLAFSTFGPENYKEVRTISGNGLNYISMMDMQLKLQNHFKVLYAHEYLDTMNFQTPLDVLKHIKDIGANSLQSTPWSRAELDSFITAYTKQFSTVNGVRLSYHPQMFVCKKD